ncbi:MAG: HD-GYP domain-containing protein [Acidobacteria bacterium]|nr:HD-GYP domain-containing protein [Acidobacteriota bacterium]
MTTGAQRLVSLEGGAGSPPPWSGYIRRSFGAWIPSQRRAALAVALSTLLVSFIHFATPAGPHEWHWVHLAAQKLYLVPILVAAAWLGVSRTILVTLAVSALFVLHIVTDWRGYEMVQADQIGDLVNLWVAALVASLLFQRIGRSLERIHRSHEETLHALAASLDLREHGTGQHSCRVREYALLLADRLGLCGEAARWNLATGAFLHDVGKIGVSDSILLKPGALTDVERAEIKRHPDLGAALIGGIESLGEARELVLCHHERYDGTGYPRGLAGEAIPLGARIFAVADAFDAMTTDRPYRRALSFREVRASIAAERGTHFDPVVLDAFMHISRAEWASVAARYGIVLAET